MKTVLNNLKPFIVYWISFAVYAIISSFEILDIEALIIIFFVVYIISDVLIGFTQDIKEILPGIILFELQLIICAIIFSINTVSSGINTFASSGNIFYSTYFENVNDILSCIISILLSPVLFGIGIGLKKLTNKRKNSYK